MRRRKSRRGLVRQRASGPEEALELFRVARTRAPEAPGLRGIVRGIRRQAGGPELEREVAGRQECEKFGLDRAPRLAPDDRREAGLRGLGERQFHAGAGDIPGDILAADEIVGCMMVEGIAFEKASAGLDQELPSLHPAVDLHRMGLPFEG